MKKLLLCIVVLSLLTSPVLANEISRVYGRDSATGDWYPLEVKDGSLTVDVGDSEVATDTNVNIIEVGGETLALINGSVPAEITNNTVDVRVENPDLIVDGDTVGNYDNATAVMELFPQRILIDENTGISARIIDEALQVLVTNDVLVTESPVLIEDTPAFVTLQQGDTHTFTASGQIVEYTLTPVDGNIHYREDSEADTTTDIVIDSSKVINNSTRPDSVSVYSPVDNPAEVRVYFRALIEQ